MIAFKRHTEFKSKLTMCKSYEFDVDGFPLVIEMPLHAIKRHKHRGIYFSVVCDIIRKGFYDILDLRKGERFILTSKELGISVIGTMDVAGNDIVVWIVTVIDSVNPTNPHGTIQIAI